MKNKITKQKGRPEQVVKLLNFFNKRLIDVQIVTHVLMMVNICRNQSDNHKNPDDCPIKKKQVLSHNQAQNKRRNIMKNKLAVIAIISAILIAPLGLILGITGICRYPKKCDGWWLSVMATALASLNWGTGILLWLAA